jgi:Uma2 family endonuclease
MKVLNKKLTADEFLELGLDDARYHHELHAGEILEMNPPVPRHSILQTDLAQLFGFYRLRHPELRAIVEPGLKLLPDAVRRPDLIVLLDPAHGGRCLREAKVFSGPPQVVVEVLSSNPWQDLVTKRELYAEAGVPEYWILSPDEEEAAFLRLEGTLYRQAACLREGRYETPLLPGFALDVGALFRGDLAALAGALP